MSPPIGRLKLAFAHDWSQVLARGSSACYFEPFLGGAWMIRLVHTCASSGGRRSEPEIKHGEIPRLRTPAGFVLGGLVSGLFWGVVGVTAWLVI